MAQSKVLSSPNVYKKPEQGQIADFALLWDAAQAGCNTQPTSVRVSNLYQAPKLGAMRRTA